MLRFAQHDNMGVITCHAERSEAESKHLKSPMPNVHWITVVYLAKELYIPTLRGSIFFASFSGRLRLTG